MLKLYYDEGYNKISSGHFWTEDRHIMRVNISIPAGLKFQASVTISALDLTLSVNYYTTYFFSQITRN